MGRWRKRGPGALPHNEANIRLWEMLLAWAEWRSLAACPRGACLPEDGAFLPKSTAPRAPGRLAELNEAMVRLDWDQRQYLIILVSCQEEPWLKGDKWNTVLSELGLSPQSFGMLLGDAWQCLLGKARKRGLV